MRTRLHTLVGGALSAGLLAACGAPPVDAEQASREKAATALQRQRDDVRAATAELVVAAGSRLPGTTTAARGGWRGCESAAFEQFRSFRYLTQVRIDAQPAARRPYLAALRPVLEAVGFKPGQPEPGPGGGSAQRITGTRGRLTASLAEVPGSGDHVVLTVSGRCRDVPEGERAEWLVKEDPTPIG